MKKILLTIDVEDWFNVYLLSVKKWFKELPFKSQNEKYRFWESRNVTVREIIVKILNLLDYFDIKATFFILGWIAEKNPNIVLEIYNRGHEIASHGYSHELVYWMNEEQFYEDTLRSKQILESIIKEDVIGYRASTASITKHALEMLKRMGFIYDASYYPTIYHDVYSSLDNIEKLDSVFLLERPCKIAEKFYEVPFSSLKIFKLFIPWSGGGYFRIIPLRIFNFGVKKILKSQDVFVFYIHPWEFYHPYDIKEMKKIVKFRRKWGVNKTWSKFEKFLAYWRKRADFLTIRRYINEYLDI